MAERRRGKAFVYMRHAGRAYEVWFTAWPILNDATVRVERKTRMRGNWTHWASLPRGSKIRDVVVARARAIAGERLAEAEGGDHG